MTQLQQLMLDGKTTGSGVADCSNYNYLTVYIEGSAALSAGTVIIEESRRLTETGNTGVGIFNDRGKTISRRSA